MATTQHTCFQTCCTMRTHMQITLTFIAYITITTPEKQKDVKSNFIIPEVIQHFS